MNENKTEIFPTFPHILFHGTGKTDYAQHQIMSIVNRYFYFDKKIPKNVFWGGGAVFGGGVNFLYYLTHSGSGDVDGWR